MDKLCGLSQQLLQGPPPNQQHLINSEILPEIENKQVKGQILAWHSFSTSSQDHEDASEAWNMSGNILL